MSVVEAAAGRLGARLRRAGVRSVDVALAVGLLVATHWSLWVDHASYYPGHEPQLIDGVTGTIGSLALLFRGRAPLGVLLTVAAVHFLPDVLIPTTPVFWGESIAFMVAAYTLALARGGRVALVPSATAVLGFFVMGRHSDDFRGTAAAGVWFGLLAVAIGSGDTIRKLRGRAIELEGRAAELERLKAAEAERAAALERSRIARELHDVIAHKVSIMVVQAGAAEHVLTHDPPQALQAVRHVQTAGRDALEELELLLGVLRHENGHGAARGPVPSLDHVEDLLEPLRAAGMEVELVRETAGPQLPPAVDASAYRVVQEALTNVLKHARGARATVAISSDRTAVRVVVRDDGPGPARGGVGGHGLMGLRERVALHGGRLTAGPGAQGGFEVCAELPREAGVP